MANTYVVASPGTALIYNRCLIGLFNSVGTEKVIRVYRIWGQNNQSLAVTSGHINRFTVNKLTTGSGGTSLQVVKSDSQNTNLPAGVVAATNMTYTSAGIYRLTAWHNTEPNAAVFTGANQTQINPIFTTFWDSTNSYSRNTNVEPLVLREGYGVALINTTNTTATTTSGPPTGDFFIEFTMENT